MAASPTAKNQDISESIHTRQPQGRGVFHGILLVIFALLVFLPPYLSLFWQTLLTEILVWGLFAMAFDLLYGYAGLLSFGQSVFFGMGVYGVALSVHWFHVNLWTALLAGLVLALISSWFIGFFAVRVGTAGFIILTALTSVVFFLIANHWQGVTGGDAGFLLTFRRSAWDFGRVRSANPSRRTILFWLWSLWRFWPCGGLWAPGKGGSSRPFGRTRTARRCWVMTSETRSFGRLSSRACSQGCRARCTLPP